jgi:O-antigen ligase
MDRERLDNWCEKGILGLVLAVLSFGPLAAGAVSAWEWLVVQGAVMGVILLWAARLMIAGTFRLLWPPICWSVLAFTCYAIFRYQQADVEYAARGELIKITVYALLFLVILNNLHRQESTQLISFVLIYLGMAISLYAVYQFFTNTPVVWHFLKPEIKPEQYMKRGTGTYICPNNFAGFLELILPLGLACTLSGRFKHTTKVFLGYASVVMLAGIAVSLSRGAWIATSLALLVLFAILFSSRSNRLPALLFVTLLAGAGVFFFKGYQSQYRWQQMFRESGTVDDVRFYLWKPALQIWQSHFWWGAGPAHFDYRFPAFRPAVIQERPVYAHNDYLNTLADWGLVGTILIASSLVLLGWGVVKSWKFVRRSNDFGNKPSNRSSFVLGSAVGLLAILFHSMVDFNMHIPANAILAVALMAMLTGHLRFATERYWVTLSWFTRIMLAGICLVGFAFLSQQWIRQAREAVLLGRIESIKKAVEDRRKTLKEMETAEAIDLEQRIDLERQFKINREIQEGVREEIELLQRAHAAEPMNFETTYKIGQAFRNLSWAGGSDYKEMAQEAMRWFSSGIRLNPFDPYNYMRYGMCLDWQNLHSDAEPYFKRAVDLDPKNYYIVAHYGWHFFVIGDYASAKQWFEESRRLSSWRSNHIAEYYLTEIAKMSQAKNGDR